MIAPDEYRGRIVRLAALMRERDIDAVLLSGESNIDYLSGFRHHAPWTLFARPFLQIITADGRAAMLTHGFLEREMRRTSVVADVRVYTHSGGAPIMLIRDTLQELGVARGRLGMELGYEQRLGISHADFAALSAALDSMRIVDAADLLWSLRRIKSPAERALMQRSAEITTAAFQACFAGARPGMTEIEVARIAAETMVHLGAERPGFVLVASGEGNYENLSGKPTERRLQHGDMLWIDMGAVYHGYWSDFCRAAYVGDVPAAIKESQQHIVDINQATIAAIKPGRALRDVASACVAAFERNGMTLDLGTNRIGHGMGLMSTEPPHVALYDETVCEDGLVFTIEPRFINRSGVFNCEELVVVEPTGAHVLTDAPRDITAIG
jgi:Xaa-Pro aminopeptidase